MPAGMPPGFNKVIQNNNAARANKFGNGGGAFTSRPASARGGNAATVAKQAVTKPTNISKNKPAHTTTRTTQTDTTQTDFGPTQADTYNPNLAPEDAALQGNYNTDIAINQNQKLNGMAGQVQLPNPMRYATAMSNMQYGPQIQATAGRIKGLIAALPGAMDSLNKAFANVDAARALQAPITSGQGVANLFGGQGGVGAAGAAAVAANQAVQANNTTANQIGQGNDQSAANARRQADWATRIQLLNNMAVNQGRSELAGEVGQRGAAKKAYFDQGLKMRGDMISQAIGNQGALQNQKIAAALASGQIEGLKLTNAQKDLLNKKLGIELPYVADQLATGIQGQKQSIITSQLQNNITKATAKAQLKQLNQSGTDKKVTSMHEAEAAGGYAKLAAMILPAGAYGTDATTGRPKVFGDLNTYFNKGVDAIMEALPDSERWRVKRFVTNELQKVASATNQWVWKNGRYHKVAPKKK